MKKMILVLAMMLIPCFAWGAAFETITVSTAAIGFTVASICPSSHACYTSATCTAPANDLRFRYDGTDPTSTVGHLIKGGTNVSFTILGLENLRAFKAIKDTSSGGDVTLSCTYEQ